MGLISVAAIPLKAYGEPMGLHGDADLALHLVGPLRLVRRDGLEVTPRFAKARAILALLGTSPALRRPRAWLQDKLWSELPPEKGSASLRQTIHRLRESVGPDSDWLTNMPGWVGLDPRRVTVIAEPASGLWGLSGEPPEFCEGLAIADPEFEDWIRDQRFACEERLTQRAGGSAALTGASAVAEAGAPKAAAVAKMLVAPPQADDEDLRTLAEMLSAEVAAGVGHFGGAEVLIEGRGAAPPSATDMLRLQMKACRFGRQAIFQAVLSDPGRELQVWTKKTALAFDSRLGILNPALQDFIADAISAAACEFARARPAASSSSVGRRYRAIGEILAFESTNLTGCDQAFASDADSAASGIHAAWRANIRVISLMERMTSSRSETEKEAVEFAKQALDKDPMNPIVNAFASEVALNVENLPRKAVHLAQVAVERGAASPFAHSSLALALARLGAVHKAHAASVHALRLASSQPNQGLWHLRCCITAVRCGRLSEAARFAQMSHELAPKLKAPLRFLAAIHFHRHDEGAAATALQKLKQLETDFSLEMMASGSYPVATLREAHLLAVTQSALL